jgi:hypothetical protein
VRLKFVIEKETLNTVRYKEETENLTDKPVIGTLYVQKSALKDFGKTAGSGPPEFLYVTVEAG